jgi:hypothetical protein
MIVDVRTRSGCCTALLENLPSIDLDQDIAAISVGRMPSMLCFVFVFLLHDVFWRREWICRPKAGHGG